MTIKLDIDNEQNFIDLWNPEKNKWERYIKCEEEDKKIKKVSDCFTSTDNKEIQFLIDNINQLGNKINEIIDKINKMEDK